MLSAIAELFSYDFIVRAVQVGILVSLCSALLGVTLVLRRFSMIGDGLSHVAFGALSVALALNASPLAVSVPVVIVAAVLLLRLSDRNVIKGDAAIALIASSALAFGVIVTALSSGMTRDVCGYMFGTILAMSSADVKLSIALSIAVIAVYVLLYNRIFAVTFDESFARSSGARVGLYNTITAVLTAVTIVLGMRMMGAMLISSLIIFPALTSMRVCKSFLSVIVLSAVLSVLCFFIGILFSFMHAVPAGACIVMVNLAAFCIFCVIGALKNRGWI
jgi:ABC-type Mn2+/Zn2+ transport system permease subunit